MPLSKVAFRFRVIFFAVENNGPLVALVRTQQPTSGDAYLWVRHPKHAAIEQVVDESAGEADSDERRYP